MQIIDAHVHPFEVVAQRSGTVSYTHLRKGNDDPTRRHSLLAFTHSYLFPQIGRLPLKCCAEGHPGCFSKACPYTGNRTSE